MSIDLEWHKLDSTLSSTLVDLLNRTLASTSRPSFIGPVEVTSLDFGTASPDVELVDLRDVYRDFLEDEESDDTESEPVKVTEGPEDDEGFEWVSRKAARSQSLEEMPAYHLLPPHMRYGSSAIMDPFSPSPNLYSARGAWGSPFANLAELRPTLPYASGYATPLHKPTMLSATPRTSFGSRQSRGPSSEYSMSPAHRRTSQGTSPPENVPEAPPMPPNHPNVQLHFHINWQSNLRITFTTSLLINYPSPMFMSLPIKLSITGLVFDGELAVAYEGERRRIHLCILDDLDPYGPIAGERTKRDSPSSGGTPPEHEDDHHGSTRPAKPLPIGQRLLPSIFIESEIGQTDKHILKNVTRVERFIQDVVRKTIEEELVFPNFHTIVLPDPQ